MLWKRELINRKPIYVNLFHGSEFMSMFSRLFGDLDSEKYEKTIAKDNEESDAARCLAIQMKKEKKKPEKILVQINKAICFAEIDSEKIGISYGLRAFCFAKLKQYSLCLMDIERAKEHKYPADLMSRLDELKSECLEKVRRNGQKADGARPELSFPADAKIPCFAQGLEVKHSKRFGKHIVSTRDLQIGQTVIVEEAYGIAPKIDHNYLQCANCFQRNANLVPCKNCAAVMFCSQHCYDAGHEKFHAFECGKRSVCAIWEATPRLVMRTVINAIKTFPKFEDLMVIVDNFNNRRPNSNVNFANPSIRAYMRFFWLSKCSDGTTLVDDMEFIDYTRAIHSAIATSSEYQSIFGSLEESRFLAHLILHHFYIVNANGFDALSLLHGTFTSELGIADTENLSGFVYAHGFYLNSCQLNHSCQPNIARIYMGTKLVGKVLRPIKPGEQLFVSYLDPLDLLDPTKYRKARLEDTYYFVCQCKSCTFKIPPFKSTGKINLDASIRRLLGIFDKPKGTDFSKKRLTVSQAELLQFESVAIKYLLSNEKLHPTAETLLIQFVLMQIWNNLGR